MWLKVNYQKEEFEYESFKANTISVHLIKQIIAPLEPEDKSIRVSTIFPLVTKYKEKIDLDNCEIHFFDFENPFRALGKINQKGSDKLKKQVFFSYGACSIILITSSKKITDEFENLQLEIPNASETWFIKDSLIQAMKVSPAQTGISSLPKIHDYSVLPNSLLPIIDEFAISAKILEKKIPLNDITNQNVLTKLVDVVNIFVKELIYLNTFEGRIPKSLAIQDIKELKEPLINESLQHQNIDRLIQINSSISYVSTQSYSGSVPILERRSLIRRSSLLGVGCAIRALTHIVDYIESAFSKINFLEIITTSLMHKANPLEGVRIANYNGKSWRSNNIDSFDCKLNSEESIKKLAYFSARHAYRESEFAITASLNSITCGISKKWTFMTITHEMLHSHVRVLFDSIFYQENGSDVENYRSFYNKFFSALVKEDRDDYHLIDSLREIIFTYCIKSIEYGSITDSKPYKNEFEEIGAKISKTKFEDFYAVFQKENRNLHEIFVHVLDLHYFYAGRIAKYIPLVWCSWSAIPHVSADIRQYILRSLLAIASVIDEEPYKRWQISVKEFKSILNESPGLLSDVPLFKQLLSVLEDEAELKKYYFLAFKNSLIIVDMVMSIFYSETVKAALWNDENIVVNSGDDQEIGFSYNLPEGFIDVPVKCPIPYLLDKMITKIDDIDNYEDLEMETTLSILALNSK